MAEESTKPRHVYWTAAEQVADSTALGPDFPYQPRDLTIGGQPAHQGERRIGIERARQVEPGKLQALD